MHADWEEYNQRSEARGLEIVGCVAAVFDCGRLKADWRASLLGDRARPTLTVAASMVSVLFTTKLHRLARKKPRSKRSVEKPRALRGGQTFLSVIPSQIEAALGPRSVTITSRGAKSIWESDQRAISAPKPTDRQECLSKILSKSLLFD